MAVAVVAAVVVARLVGRDLQPPIVAVNVVCLTAAVAVVGKHLPVPDNPADSHTTDRPVVVAACLGRCWSPVTATAPHSRHIVPCSPDGSCSPRQRAFDRA